MTTLRSIGDIDREAEAWGANCGPAALAAALELQLAEARNAVSPGGKFPGYMGANAMKSAVSRAGARIVSTWSRPPLAPERVFEVAGPGRFVVLLQWRGPWDSVPRAAATHRHWIAFVHASDAFPGWDRVFAGATLRNELRHHIGVPLIEAEPADVDVEHMGSARPGARRVWTWTRHCAHPGCTERARYEYERQRDMLDSQRRTKGEYLCSRHTRPAEVLSPTNTKRVTEVTARRGTADYPLLKDLYWGPPLGNGFAHGLGWKAWADDFPEGTRIRVTVEVLLPEKEPTEVGRGVDEGGAVLDALRSAEESP